MAILRIGLADGREIDLTVDADHDQGSPWALLRRLVVDGELALSDTDAVSVSEVSSVEVVVPDAPAGPGWGPGLQDEDAATALQENYAPPPDDRPR